MDVKFGAEVGGYYGKHEIHNCNQCGAAPNDHHMPGCSVERCVCGRQAISCGCDDETYYEGRAGGTTVWRGVWPGTLEAEAAGYWCRWAPNEGGWLECSPDHPDATADLNRWYAMGCPQPLEGTLPW
jgi:hypothetical protein